ncbi:MAG: C40 family peptidase [Fimbriimonadaceae bacterium]|nr:C40 family peptidase [Fimbriimonadaceae bacterium]QYK55410.1 MAG: C40 family peptidase [Fimbriimonadaceae bacterium]
MEPGQNFATVSKLYGIGYQKLIDANPDVEPTRIRPGTVIVIPGRVKEEKPSAAPVQDGYKVQNGDTDWSIARRFNIKPSDLRAMNPNVDWRYLKIGSYVTVPTAVAKAEPKTSAPTAPAAPASTPAMKPASKTVGHGRHKVRVGENDWTIARKYGITSTKLRELNPDTDWGRLKIGAVLHVPGEATGSKAETPGIARIATKRARVIRDNVIVRSGAKTSASRLAMVSPGRIAKVRDRVGDWYKLEFGGGTVGWVRGDLLASVTASEAIAGGDIPRATKIAKAAPTKTRTATRSTVVATYREPAKSVASPRSSRPVAPLSAAAAGSVVGTALAQLGTPYRWGGTSRGGFDCSGFTSFVYSRNGKSIPRTSIEQSRSGTPVSKGGLQKGDLVFFNTRGSRVSHVGIYIGGGKFVHASSGGGRVRVNNLSDSYYSKRYAGARRVSGVKGSKVAADFEESDAPKKKVKTVVADEPKAAPAKERESAPAASEHTIPSTLEMDPAPKVGPKSDVVGR